MLPPLVISIVALCISIASFGLGIANYLRDRDRVKASCRLTTGYDGQDPHLLAWVVNAGRRPVLLRMWGGTDKAGRWGGTMLKQDQGGHRLSEHERLDLTILGQDVDFMSSDAPDIQFVDLWFEDTLGRRHPMKGAKEALRDLLSDAQSNSALSSSRQPRSIG